MPYTTRTLQVETEPKRITNYVDKNECVGNKNNIALLLVLETKRNEWAIKRTIDGKKAGKSKNE